MALTGAIAGQSNGQYMFDQRISAPAANANTRNFDSHDPVGVGWYSPLGNGAVVLGNELNDALNTPIDLVDIAYGGSCLTKKAGDLDLSTNWYWWNDTTNAPGPLYIASKASLDTYAPNIDFLIWDQGEQDGKFAEVSKTDYKNALVSLLAEFRQDFGANLPIYISITGRSIGYADSDASWEKVRTAQYEVVAENPLNFIADTRYDLAIDGGGDIHLGPGAQETRAVRNAQAILYNLDEVFYGRGAQILEYRQITSSIFDIKIKHEGGIDFTPTTAITEFRIWDDAAEETVTSAVRQNATTIRVTISGTITGTPTIRYMYGDNPTITGAVKDNTGLNLPLEGNADIVEATKPVYLKSLPSFFQFF